MILSSQYFTMWELAIANAEPKAPNSNLLGNVETLKSFIEHCEREVLSLALQRTNYKLFYEDSIDHSTSTVKSAADQKWKDLFSGKEYKVDGVDVIWRGLVFTEGGLKRSLLAHYTYYCFMKHDISHHGSVGLMIEKAKNSKRADYAPKTTLAYRTFLSMVNGDLDSSPHHNGGRRTLDQFINDMNALDPSTYPGWRQHCFPKLNIMSI